MTVRLSELAELVNGVLSGDGGIEITGAEILRFAGPGEITLADRPHLLEHLAHSSASAAVVPQDLHPQGMPYIAVPNVRSAFAQIVSRFRPPRITVPTGISATAVIADSARLGDAVTIHPEVVIGEDVVIGRGTTLHAGVCIQEGCQIGEDVTIFPRAVLYPNTVVGDRVLIHAGAVVGAFGFGYELIDGRHVSAPQLGSVEIGDDVEIGANTTIDRGTFGPTRIGAGTKIDNLVMIGHNCRIGRHNIICGQVGIAGSCTTGDYVVLAGQAGLRDHLELADGVMVGAQSGVGESLTAAGKYLGTPAVPARRAMQAMLAQQRLPDLVHQVAELRRRLQGHDEQKKPQDAA
jgi:UDP-3-O-[3-hydroxymyristoyl] glucosamine N-acyltransferase